MSLQTQVDRAANSATVAITLALGGSSYAALNLPKASVGAKQLKKNSVTSPKVKRGSLLVSDFKASQRASLRGPQGPEGPRGEVGPSGATKVISRQSAFQIIPADSSQSATVECNPGEVATGGGIQITNGSLLDMVAIQSMPTLGPSNVPTGWYARGSNVDSNNDNAGTVEVRAYAICASP
ncbi:MAG TPA: hypothetical protein VNC17_19775 [Thermoleophilaceae bacterium]|nr:hypothetical protein [Thermoleophilaceae bacterium]